MSQRLEFIQALLKRNQAKQNMSGLSPLDRAYLEGISDTLQSFLKYELKNQETETMRPEKLGKLVSSVVRLEDIQQYQRESKWAHLLVELEELLKHERTEANPHPAIHVNSIEAFKDVKYAAFATTVNKAQKKKNIAKGIKVIKAKDKFYAVLV